MDEIVSAYAQQAMKSVPRWLGMGLDIHVKNVQILTLAEHPRKFVRYRLRLR
jgi:hypothetical protein